MMLKQGCSRRDFSYIIDIMNITSEKEWNPSKQFVDVLKRFNDDCYYAMKTTTDDPIQTAELEAAFENFKSKYESWKDSMENLNAELKSGGSRDTAFV